MRNKLMLVVALVGLAFVVTDAVAGPTVSDVVISADRGVSLTTKLVGQSGPSLYDFATDGSAWAKFIWFSDDCTDRADSTQIIARVMVQLRDYTPPRSPYFPSGPDSVYIDLITATEVILSR